MMRATHVATTAIALVCLAMSGCGDGKPNTGKAKNTSAGSSTESRGVNPEINNITWLEGGGKRWLDTLRLNADGTYELISEKNYLLVPRTDTKSGTWSVLSVDMRLILLDGRNGYQLQHTPPSYGGWRAAYAILKRRQDLKTTDGFRHVGKDWYLNLNGPPLEGPDHPRAKDVIRLLRRPEE
jgi:hypothetical protein